MHPGLRSENLLNPEGAGAPRVRLQVAPASLPGGGRRPAVSQVRAGIAYLWTEVLGRPGRPLAPVLGLQPVAVYAAARRCRAERAHWDGLMDAS